MTFQDKAKEMILDQSGTKIPEVVIDQLTAAHEETVIAELESAQRVTQRQHSYVAIANYLDNRIAELKGQDNE